MLPTGHRQGRLLVRAPLAGDRAARRERTATRRMDQVRRLAGDALQLVHADTIQARRRQIWDTYDAGLRDWAAEMGVGTPAVPAHCEQPYHMFYLLMPSLEKRQGLISHLKAEGILSVFHYLPLHLSDMGRRFGGKEGDCPVTEDVSDRLVRLPFYNDLTSIEQDQVIEAIHCFSF